MVGPIRGVARVLAGSQARVTEQFAHDSSIAHRPAVAWLEVRRIVAVFDVAPPDSLGVTSRAVDQVGDKDIREPEPITPSDFPVARQSKSAVPQQRPLLSQKPGRIRRGSPEVVTVCQQRSSKLVHVASPVI
jgi:hypothetical protein